jgi:aryl-alcohol dehydrogenase-like predicted oxidoreductase
MRIGMLDPCIAGSEEALRIDSQPRISLTGDRHVILGLWPIAGVTTIGVTESDAEATIDAAIDMGITCFDTAFSYGYGGESDRLLGKAIRGDRDRFAVIGKVGQRWDSNHARVIDGSPTTLIGDAVTSLRRMGIDHFDLLMLHCPDPNVPIQQSAAAIASLRDRGLCKQVGLCNADPAQRQAFATEVRCAAVQCPLNLMQRQSLDRLIPDCVATDCDVHVYWTLMKGLLSGRISRDHQFPDGDSRPRYEIYQGDSRRRTHEVLDRMRRVAEQSELTIAQLSIGWALSQSGVTAALVGARRPEQIIETAGSAPLAEDLVKRIDAIVEQVDGEELDR